MLFTLTRILSILNIMIQNVLQWLIMKGVDRNGKVRKKMDGTSEVGVEAGCQK